MFSSCLEQRIFCRCSQLDEVIFPDQTKKKKTPHLGKKGELIASVNFSGELCLSCNGNVEPLFAFDATTSEANAKWLFKYAHCLHSPVEKLEEIVGNLDMCSVELYIDHGRKWRQFANWPF